MKTKTRILVADGNAVYQSVLREMLSGWGYDVVPAADGIDAWNLLQAGDGPRLAILESTMPGMDGIEICRMIWADARLSYPYILLLTGKGSADELYSALDAGADDFVTRPFNSQELRARLRVGCRVVKLQERLIQAREELYEQSTRDGLTGLWNRVTIFQILDNELARASRSQGSLAVMMVDLDNFKRINDTHGHLAGDDVLREAARRMSSILRQYDSVGRYGGEEFLVMVPGCDFEGSLAAAERLRQVVAGAKFPTSDGALAMSCSVGVAWAGSAHLLDANRMIGEADTALYAAKRGGRNRVEFFSPGDRQTLPLRGDCAAVSVRSKA